MNNIKVGCWNINGFKTENMLKSDDDNFTNIVKNNDILALVETHLGNDDYLNLDGFTVKHFKRLKHKNARKASGGISVFIKNTISKGVQFLDTRNKNSEKCWIKLQKDELGLTNDIYICFAYISPNNSSFSKRQDTDAFQNIMADINKYVNKGKIMLLGDFNARTYNICENIIDDNDSFIPLPDDYVADVNIIPRVSQDMIINEYGKELLEICTSCQLRILNGRKFGDLSGKYTCHKYNGSSVVDYCIVSDSMYSEITHFKVHPWLPLLSDHSMITVSIKRSKQKLLRDPIKQNIGETLPRKFVWSKSSGEKYEQSFNDIDINKDIKHLLLSVVNNNNVEMKLNELNDIFNKAADRSLKKVNSVYKQSKQKRKKQIFHDTIYFETKRHIRFLARTLNINPFNMYIRSKLYSLKKKLKKHCKEVQKNHTDKIIDTLNTTHDSNPQVYWDLIKQLQNHNKLSSQTGVIQTDDWVKHYQNLLYVNESESNSLKTELQKLENEPFFSELDYKIRYDEVKLVIKSLKNNKACGLDSVSAEMIKQAPTKLHIFITKLFNVLYTYNIYPDIWRQGYITSIYKKGNPDDTNNYRGITINNVMSKIFSTVLNNRIKVHFEGKLNSNQIGFRKNSRTSDHIFVLKTSIEKYVQKNGKIYTCFVDFQKAFDKVWRTGLLYKLLKFSIRGKFYDMIKNIYSKTYSYIKNNGSFSTYV